jgi:hypothetical protein
MSTEQSGHPSEPDPQRPTATPNPTPAQLKLQILSTEHWSLLASRGLAWNESFTRASMFLSTLSFAVVALALVGQASGFGQEFRLFALVILPIVLLLGLATSVRMDSANHHDVQCVIGMNRIRAAYLEIAPDLERYFVMGTTDDVPGIVRTMAVLPDRSARLNLLSASPTVIAVLNSLLAGAVIGLAVMQFGMAGDAAVVAGVLGFLGVGAAWAWYSRNLLRHIIQEYEPMFPSAEPSPPPKL